MRLLHFLEYDISEGLIRCILVKMKWSLSPKLIDHIAKR